MDNSLKNGAPACPDLEDLEAKARAATPGPWSWWTSNSFLRLTAEGGPDGGVLHSYTTRGNSDIACSAADQAFIAAANPAAILALIVQARASQQPIAQQADSRAPAPADERALLSGVDQLHRTKQELDHIQARAAGSHAHVEAAHQYQHAVVKLIEAALAHQAAPAQLSAAEKEEILALHRQLAAEKLRADQGWQRADAKSRECIELRERFAAAPTSDQQAGAVAGMWQLVEDLATFNGARGMSSVNELVGRAKAILAAPAAIEQAGAQPVAQAASAPTAWMATDLDGRGDVAFTKEEAKRRAGEGCTIFYPLYEPSDLATPTPATDQDDRIKDALNTLLWLYRRLPQAYGKPSFVDKTIMAFADVLGMDAPEAIKERARYVGAASAADQAREAAIEVKAKEIYSTFPGAENHPWVEHGNSTKQDEARSLARKALAATPVTDQPKQGEA